jgi:HD-GYP domain-containing protein (c-di-GMP phosphodiesterase class II)
MYILDLEGKSGSKSSVFSVEGYVLSTSDIDQIKAEGYTSVFVDSVRSQAVEAAGAGFFDEFSLMDLSAPTGGGALVSYQDEYRKAMDVQSESRDVSRAIAVAALSRSPLPIADIRAFLSDLTGSVQRNEGVLLSLGKMKKNEDYIFLHGLNVTILAVALARQLNVKAEYLPDVALAGFLHDVGKLFVSREVLNFPGKLSPEQLAEVQSHVLRGHDFLLQVHPDLPKMVFDGVLDHQERYNGSGYPGGKAGVQISFIGRLLAVADVYDAVSSSRSYRSPLAPHQVLSTMYASREADFSPGFIEAIIAALGVYPPGSPVLLSNQQTAVVIEANEVDSLRPKVVLLADGKGLRVRPKIMDLGKMLTLSITGPALRLPANVNMEDAVKNAV